MTFQERRSRIRPPESTQRRPQPERSVERKPRPPASTGAAPDLLLRSAEALALGETIQGSIAEAGIAPTLVVFFSIASVQSQHLLAYVRAWHERYAPAGLCVVAVHSPELDRTRSESALRVTALRWGLDFPIVQDPDRKIWHALGNMGWDACHIFAQGGKHRFTHPAGTSMRKVELDLQEVVRLPQPMRLLEPLFSEDAPGTVRLQPSDDLQLGFKMGAIANLEGFLPQQTLEYQPAEPLGSKPLLRGGWEAAAECLIARPQAGRSSVLELRCNAKDVFVLAESKEPSRLRIEADGGSTEVAIQELRLYPLVQGEHLRPHHLRLVTEDDGVQLYMLRFTTEAHKTRDVEDV